MNRRNTFLSLSLLLIALGAINSPPSFAESPAPPTTFQFSQFQPGKPLRLVAYGDTRFTDPSVVRGTNPRVRKWLADRIVVEHPQAILLTGDTPYTGGKDGDWEDFQQETEVWRASRLLVLPTTGNHEVYGGHDHGIANYLKNFPQVGGHLYYSALLGNVEVISLDCTQGTAPESPQATWFASQLEHISRQVEFLLILYHTPWVADRQSQMFANLPTREALSLRSILETHLPKLHARVSVFNGHIHNYERFERLRVEYIVTGGGGAEPYPLLYRGHSDLYRDTAFPVYHFVTLDVSPGKLHAVMWKVKDPDAPELGVEAKDEFTITAARQPTAQPKRSQPRR